ncbi:lamin tail domain-containing protein 1 [Loxodonta africana]|uniref:lamin tail domain-containing protein 1 n=1 Tax=Loxodonta africana TaxID=9785 RepID=UPI0030CDF8E0
MPLKSRTLSNTDTSAFCVQSIQPDFLTLFIIIIFVHRKEDKQEASSSMTQRSFVHFFPTRLSSDDTTLPFSRSLSHEMPLSCYVSSSQISGLTTSTSEAKASKSSPMNHPKIENSLGVSSCTVPKKQTPFLASEASVIGEGEDYFHSLFGDSKKIITCSSHLEKTWKHFPMVLDEVGHFRSSALGHIKIADVNVNGLFVRLINSSHDKELEIGDHILQQNLNGQTVASYRFLPKIIMQANSTVTVWAAASEAKDQPPSDFLWKEQNKFRTSPNCTTILCKPNGEAIAWYTPIHWKQAWAKLETDIEFNRCSVVTATPQKNMFQWPTSITKEKQDQQGTTPCQMEYIQLVIKRKKEIPPTLFPTRSPWCHNPNVPGHPYCPLTKLHDICSAGRHSVREPSPRSSKPDPAPAASICDDSHVHTGNINIQPKRTLATMANEPSHP